MKIRLVLGALILGITTVAYSQINPPFAQCPPVGADTSCAILIVVTDKAVNVYTDPSQGPYDTIEDTLIGVQNNSSGVLQSLPLSSPNPIFGFDGDGICGISPITGLPYDPGPPDCPYGPTGYEGPGTSFSGMSADQTAGVVNFTNGLLPGTSTYFSLELAISTVCAALSGQALNVPLSKQYSAPWGSTVYDGYPAGDTKDTMQRWGCATTSSAMIINYFGGNTDPGKLNTWLTNNGGYTGAHSINWFSVATYSSTVLGVPLTYHPGFTPSDFTVDNYLCGNDPVILQVTTPTGGTHFVVATGGKTTSTGSTYLINDPGYACTELDQQKCYGNQYQGIRTYSPGAAPLSGLQIVAASPVELLVTAPNGQQTGFDSSTGAVIQQIPSSDYYTESIGDDLGGDDSTHPVKKVEIGTPVDGQYALQVLGIGTGSYTLYMSGYDVNGTQSTQTFSGITSTGETLTYNIGYSSSSGSQITVTGPFAAFSANVKFFDPPPGFNLNGAFTLGPGSTAINPVTQAVSLQLGNYSVAIPAGSFTQNKTGSFVFKGVIGGVSLNFQITPVRGSNYSFSVDAKGINLTWESKQIPLTLSIGASFGTTLANASFQ
jgi:hypothetical protein